MSKISISVVLSQLDQAEIDGVPQKHHIRYCKKDGTRGEIRDAQKGIKHPKKEGAGSGHPFNHSIKKSGTILLYSEEKGGTREILIDLLTHFNGTPIQR